MDLALVVFSGFFVTSCVMERGIAAWDAWHEAHRIHRRDAWMREQCQDQSFFANMRVHSDACEVVQRNAMRGALLHAVSAFMDARASWVPPLIVLIAGIAARWAARSRNGSRWYISVP